MKSTGIVRNVDDLGRIAIPKEIRRTLKIHENDPMELFIEDGMLCIKKYSPYTVDDVLESVESILNDEDVSRKLCQEDKEVVRATVNMIRTRLKTSQ